MLGYAREYVWVRVSIRRTLQMANRIPDQCTSNESTSSLLYKSEFSQLPSRFIDQLRAAQKSQEQAPSRYPYPMNPRLYSFC